MPRLWCTRLQLRLRTGSQEVFMSYTSTPQSQIPVHLGLVKHLVQALVIQAAAHRLQLLTASHGNAPSHDHGGVAI